MTNRTLVAFLGGLLFAFATSVPMVWSQEAGKEKKKAATPSSSATFVCDNCKKNVGASEPKCKHCGLEFADIQCPVCRKMIPSASRKCPHCDTYVKNDKLEKLTPSTYGKGKDGSSARKKHWTNRLHLDAYFRIHGRNDFEHSSDTLGWWPLYGRLMNETNWFQLGLAIDLLEKEKKGDPAIRVYGRIEGNSVRTGDDGNGNLSKFNITQFYLETENIPYKNFVTQTGTLWYNMGYIGIYDFYVAQTFWETVGFRAGMRYDKMEYFLGLGDSGYSVLQQRDDDNPGAGYSSVPTLGGLFKINLGAFSPSLKKVWMGTSLMLRYEFGSDSNRYAPKQTEGVTYEDILQGDVLEEYLDDNPSDLDGNFFPSAKSVDDFSWRWTFWLGFGPLELGPLKLKWNDFSVSLENIPAELNRRFTEGSVTKDVFISELTDERYVLTIADESYWVVAPGKLDIVLGFAVGYARDQDNSLRPDDHNRFFYSLVVRPQYYFNDYFHFLTEFSFAMEKSLNGNRYREHYDSIMANSGGVVDPDGLEWGDSDTKYTIQFKTGIVFNPGGKGIYNRPSIRLLFGMQYSNVHAAFGNSMDDSLNRSNTFNTRKDYKFHYMISIEVEHWFGG